MGMSWPLDDKLSIGPSLKSADAYEANCRKATNTGHISLLCLEIQLRTEHQLLDQINACH